jgi:hypothetical protein
LLPRAGAAESGGVLSIYTSRGKPMPCEPHESQGALEAADTDIGVERAPARQAKGQTVSELARRYRVSEEKVRRWIRSGELPALNVADVHSRKPRFVVPPEAQARFERGRSAAQPRPAPRRRRRPEVKDYYPDD